MATRHRNASARPTTPPRDRQEHALGQQLSGEAAAAGAERRPHRQFLLPRQRPRQQQVGDVGARDQQHESHRRAQHDERETDTPDCLLLQRQHAKRQSAVGGIEIRMVPPQVRGESLELGSRLLDRRARRQRREDVVVLAVSDPRRVGRQRQRQQDLRLLDDAERRHDLARELEGGRQHPDHFVRLTVQRQRAADGVGAAAVAAHPRAVRQQCLAARARRVVGGGEEGADERLRAEHCQQVRGDADRPYPLRLAVAGEVRVGADRDRHRLEAADRVLDVEVLRRREPVFGDAEPGRRVPEDELTVRVLVRQRPQQEGAGDAEDRGVGADADCQRQHGDDEETGACGQRPDRVADVLQRRAQHVHYAKLTPRSGPAEPSSIG